MADENNGQSIQDDESRRDAVSITKENKDLIKSSVIKDKKLSQEKAADNEVDSCIQHNPPKCPHTESETDVIKAEENKAEHSCIQSTPNVITEKQLEEYKTVHTEVESMIQSIPSRYRHTKGLQKATVVKRSNISKLASSVAKQLCDAIGFLPNDMQESFSKQVINIFEQLVEIEIEAKKWFHATVSGDWDGKTHIAAVLIVGEGADDKVSVGIALMAEEWQKKNAPMFNATNLEKYTNYILYKQLSKAIEN